VWGFLLNSAQNDGHELKDFSLQGYSGVKCGQFFYGGRETDMMFQATGASGTLALQTLKEVTFRGNVSRLDVQTTIRREAAKAKSIQDLAEHRRQCFKRGETRACGRMDIVEKAKGDDTLYLGSPNSDSRLAIYNAAARHPSRYSGDAQRYEARFHKRCSADPYARLKAANSITACCGQIVVGKCQALGLKERWHVGIPPVNPMPGTVLTDDEKSLAWFVNDVRRKAIELTRKGRGEEVAEALGCVEFVIRPELIPSNDAPEIRKRMSKLGLLSDNNAYAP
jgi:hypothetical protein